MTVPVTVRFPAAEADRIRRNARETHRTYSDVIRAAVHAITPEGIMDELAANYRVEDGLTVADIVTILRLADERRWDCVRVGEAVSFEQSILSGRARCVITIRLEEIVYEPVAPPSTEEHER